MGAAVKERPTSVRDQYEKLLKAPKPVMRIDGRVQASNRLYTKHRKTLEQTAHRKPGSDKKGTDHTLPYSATHEHLKFGSKTYGAKKKAAYNERQREIRSANVGLVKRFASIISTPTEFEVAAVEHKISNSKNIIGAKREQRRINAANAYHAERLRKLNPCYSSKKWDKDRMDQLVFLKRHMKDFSLLDQKSKCAALEPEPSMSEISRARDAWCKRRARTTPEREAKVRLAVERAKHRLVQRDRDLAALASGKTRRLAKMKAKLKGQEIEESEDDEYADDDFEMPAGFEDAFGGSAARPGTTKPKKRQDFGRPGTTVGRGRGAASEVRGDDGFHPDENYGDDGFDDDSDYDEPGAEPRRVRTPNRPVTPLPEPIIDRDFLDRDYDTPYTVGRFPLKKSEPVPVSKVAEARHTTRRDDLKACDGNGKPNLPLEIEVETQRNGDEFTISFLAKIRGGGGSKTTHKGRLPVLCTMDDAMAAHYLERLCERVIAQACVDYNNAKTEAQLRDEGALAADLARYVAFKESFHAPPSFTAPNKYT